MDEEVEVRITWPDQTRVYLCRLIAERDPAGRIVSVLNLAQDATERHRDEELRRRLLVRLIRVREDERRTLARELHDSIGQTVTALAYGTESVLQATDLDEARRHAERLRTLDDRGLEAAFERQATDFIASFGIAVDVAVSGVRAPRRGTDRCL